MWRAAWISLVTALSLVFAAPGESADWGTIEPGKSTMDNVRARFGPPTRTTTQKTDGYDTAQWVYEAGQAPEGLRRLTVDFGLLVGGAFRPPVVRAFRLDPQPGVFTRSSVVAGWGEPDGESPVGQLPRSLFYDVGLLVYFDKEGWQVESMLFVMPQVPKPKGGVGGQRP
jgi:hypothetical protein